MFKGSEHKETNHLMFEGTGDKGTNHLMFEGTGHKEGDKPPGV